MKLKLAVSLGLAIVACAVNLFAADVLLPQRLLYIGHRASEFEPLLKQHFVKVESVSRDKFQPSQANNFDVVLLDWPQGDSARDERAAMTTPLGKREAWNKPTVLLGSAGLNLAVAWKLKGGSGCTCLAPVAYGIREHEIFKSPIAIDVTTTNIPTPVAFVPELKTDTIPVHPLVNNIRRFETVINDYQRGWATHYYEFADMPEVEIFCGGVNEQTPRSAAFWRQGNLLHFGFEQSPNEMNETGRALLVNAIAYISRFTEDRPIDITPSVFGSEKIAVSRDRAKRYFVSFPREVTNVFSTKTLASFNWQNSTNDALTWFASSRPWLHPDSKNFLEIDVQAKSLGVPFDSADFLPKTIAALRDGNTKDAAIGLLMRYTSEGPGANANADAWEKWWRENSPYLFYSELGCYRWYIDPLAKKRGIPTKDLRGPARADRH